MMRNTMMAILASLLVLASLPGPVAAAVGPAEPAAALPCPDTAAPLCLKLLVATDGLVRVTAADLQAAGWNTAAVDPRTFTLNSQGQPVAIAVPGEADGRLDSGDFVEFYGQRFRGTQMQEKYTDDNVYWLAAGGSPGPRMQTANVAPGGAAAAPPSFWTTHYAEENHYWFSHQTLSWPTRDTWWWEYMYVGAAPAERAYTLRSSVPSPAPESYDATLSIEIASRRKTGTHYFRVSLNEPQQQVLSPSFDNHQVLVFEGTLPAAWLRRGDNDVIVTVVNPADSARQVQAALTPEELLRQQQLDAVVDAGIVGLPKASPAAYANDILYANYYKIRYRRLYQAWNDQLPFTADQAGPQRFTLTGFSSPDLLLYDITNPLLPLRLTGASVGTAGDGSRTLTAQLNPGANSQYLALAAGQARKPRQIAAPLPSTVRATSNRANWIIISHADFLPQAERLASYRASHDGFKTAVVNVAELYEQFNYGIFHPEAIRRFVDHAVKSWQGPAPQYIVLLGDGNWNFKGYGAPTYGTPEPNRIPPYLVWEDPWQGEVPSDNAFVNLDADPVPELSVGRLPARSLAEATTMVDKIIAYEAQQPGAAAWQKRALFVADNTDSTGDYPLVADRVIANHLPPDIEPIRDYLGVTHPVDQVGKVTDTMVQAINDGVLMVNYLGHGSLDWWAHEGIWNTTMTPRLSNGSRLPFVVTLNCLDGYFAHANANQQAVAEEMLRHAAGGSVVSWSPSGLGTTFVENLLHTSLLDAILWEGVQRVGPATVQAKAELFAVLGGSSPVNTTLLHTMTIFGDPATTVGAVSWQRMALPLVTLHR